MLEIGQTNSNNNNKFDKEAARPASNNSGPNIAGASLRSSSTSAGTVTVQIKTNKNVRRSASASSDLTQQSSSQSSASVELVNE